MSVIAPIFSVWEAKSPTDAGTPRRGKRIVYFAEHQAVALIEVLVNLEGDPELFPDTFQLMKAEAADRTTSVLNQKTLPADWRNNIPPRRH